MIVLLNDYLSCTQDRHTFIHSFMLSLTLTHSLTHLFIHRINSMCSTKYKMHMLISLSLSLIDVNPFPQVQCSRLSLPAYSVPEMVMEEEEEEGEEHSLLFILPACHQLSSENLLDIVVPSSRILCYKVSR